MGEKVSDEHFLLFNCFGGFYNTLSFYMILQFTSWFILEKYKQKTNFQTPGEIKRYFIESL